MFNVIQFFVIGIAPTLLSWLIVWALDRAIPTVPPRVGSDAEQPLFPERQTIWSKNYKVIVSAVTIGTAIVCILALLDQLATSRLREEVRGGELTNTQVFLFLAAPTAACFALGVVSIWATRKIADAGIWMRCLWGAFAGATVGTLWLAFDAATDPTYMGGIGSFITPLAFMLVLAPLNLVYVGIASWWKKRTVGTQ